MVTTAPGSLLLDTVRLLVRKNVGSAVAVESDAIVGIVTERDVLRLAARDPEALPSVGTAAVMTSSVLVGQPDDSVLYVAEAMSHRRIRHLPVVEEGRLAGIVSMGDLVKVVVEHVEAEARDLRQYASVFLDGDTSGLTGHNRRSRARERKSGPGASGWSSEVTASDVLREKGTGVVSLEPSTPMLAAMGAMAGPDIGSVLVVEGGRARGILTERDVLRCAAKDPLTFHRCAVGELMTGDLVVCAPESTAGEMMAVMTRNRFRHLPVIRDGALEGIVTLRDLVQAYLRAASTENRHLRDRISGRTRTSGQEGR